jgi:hypothetical protein
MELVLLDRLFGECRHPFFGLSLFLRKGHPFANDFSARLVVFISFCNSRALARPYARVAFCTKVLLVLRGLGEVSVNRLFAQCLACFEPMQTMYEDEAITIRPNQDGYLLSDFQYTLGDLLNGLWFERCAAFYRHVDVRD